jgi:cyclase
VDLVRETAEHVFVPLMVGGGVRTLDDMRQLLRAGADKVCINTAAVQRPEFIREASRTYGSQCVVVAIETLRQRSGGWGVFTDNGRQATGLEAYDWARRAVDLGAGEILLTSVDHEGTRQGFETALAEKLVNAVEVPVILHGGAGTAEHFSAAARSGVSAVAAASVLHYQQLTIGQIKLHLQQAGVEVRQ